MTDTTAATAAAPAPAKAETTEKPPKEKKVREPKPAPPPPTPIAAQPTPLADRQITDKKLEKLNKNLKECIDAFTAIQTASQAPKGVAVLAGRGALPHDVPEGYQAISLATEVIQGRRVSGTLFSSRLKNLLIQNYSPMQVGPWLIFDKKH
jgi:hypothetical protein